MNKCHLEIDIAKCMNCNNCVVATKDEYSGNDFPGYAKSTDNSDGDILAIKRYDRGTGSNIDVNYMPVMCNHCDNAPCVKNVSDGAVYKRDDGITMIDPVKSRGRREIVKSCPYGAIHWNEEHQVPQIWFFDAHLLDQGNKVPRCVDACPTEALRFHHCSDSDMEQQVDKNQLQVLSPRLGTKPRVYYRNLYLCQSQFIGGNLLTTENGKEANVSTASVELQAAGATVAKTESDEFGYFRFDGIADGSEGYSIRISHPRHGEKNLPLDQVVKESVNLEIVL